MPKNKPKAKPSRQKATARKSVVAKAQKKKAEKALAVNRKNFLEVVHEDVVKITTEVEQRVAKTAGELYMNQKSLEQSHQRLDDQFAVLTRLMVSNLNEVRHQVSQLAVVAYQSCPPEAIYDPIREMIAKLEKLPPITYEEVNKTFQLYELFKQRADFREHTRTWYMGGDITALPPPPVVEAKEEQKVSAPGESVDFPEGAQIFGGNYGGQSRDEITDSGGEAPAEADAVPEVPELHGDGSGSEEHEQAGAAL